MNCCDHDVEICDENGNIIMVFKPSGNHARVRTDDRIVRYLGGVPVKVRENERVVGLPEPEEGMMYIVSEICLKACPDRKDLLACGGKRRDKYGRIIGWTGFVSN